VAGRAFAAKWAQTQRSVAYYHRSSKKLLSTLACPGYLFAATLGEKILNQRRKRKKSLPCEENL